MESCTITNYVPIHVRENVMCRLCGCTGNTAELTLMTEDSYLTEIIKAETNIIITNSDPFPRTVCLSCLGKINLIHCFREQCKRTQKVLEQMYNTANNQKVMLTNNKIDCEKNSQMVTEWMDEDLKKSNQTKQIETSAINIIENNLNNKVTSTNSFNNDSVYVEEDVPENVNIVPETERLDQLAIPQMETYSEKKIKTEYNEEIIIEEQPLDAVPKEEIKLEPIIENNTNEPVETETKESLLYSLLTKREAGQINESEINTIKCETIEISEDSSDSETNENIIYFKQEAIDDDIYHNENNDRQDPLFETHPSKHINCSDKGNISTICNQRPFQTEGHVRKQTHVKERQFTCKTCGESFSTVYLLLNHEETHTCEEEEFDISEDISVRPKKTIKDLRPTKSKAIYEKEFKLFVNWKLRNAITVMNETVMMAYFQELSEKYSPNSLWTKYSILKSTLMINNNDDISRFKHLVNFLKKRSKGYIPKKTKVLTGDQVLTFLKNAPNENYLMHKVVLVMGVFGGLRRDEMVKMTVDDIQDNGSFLFVRVPEMKTAGDKGFTIVEEEEIGALKLVREYASLRPSEITERRFFLTYGKNRCTRQPVGKNTIGSAPKIIAKYLKLDNYKDYTGHCLRRTSSRLLVEAEAAVTFEALKRYGQWKSTRTVITEDSLASKNRIAYMIASSMSTSGEARGNPSSSIC